MEEMMKRLSRRGLAICTVVLLAGAATYSLWTWKVERLAGWNERAITATFIKTDFWESQDRMLFHYVLRNATRSDYRLESKAEMEFMVKLKNPPSLSRADLSDGTPNYVKLTELPDLPIFIPAGESVPFYVSEFCPYPKKPTDPQNENIAGFVLFDKTTRYRINFPRTN
jgi:hypothetical protein